MTKNMKKLLLCCLLTFSLTGCVCDGDMATVNFEQVCHHNSVTFYRDIDTDIMYLKYEYSNYRNGITVYYNADGEPMSYKEFSIVHTEKYHKG